MSALPTNDQPIYECPAELLQNLIQFDTTNPPGNEAQCVSYINSLLTKAGFETTILAKDSNRPNLVTRLEGRGTAPPLLLYGHVDVVATSNQNWTHPPFEGKEARPITRLAEEPESSVRGTAETSLEYSLSLPSVS